MATTNIQHLSANEAKILFDNTETGTLFNVNCQDTYNLEPVSGIGDIHVIEYVPTIAMHSIACETATLIKSTLRSLGIATENGDDALLGKIFDIEIFDNNGKSFRKYTGCSYDSGSVTINKNTVVVSNASFKALNVTGTGV